jgi:tRNA-dihydrouridine synthase
VTFSAGGSGNSANTVSVSGAIERDTGTTALAHLTCLGSSRETVDLYLDALEEHIRLLISTGAHLARARSLVGWYLKGMPHASELRGKGMSCSTLDDYLELIGFAREQLR